MSKTPMLSGNALRSDEIPDGNLSLDEKVLTYIPRNGAPQQISLVDSVGASAESCTLVVSFMPVTGGGGWGCSKLRRELVVSRFLCHNPTQASGWAEALWRVMNGMAPDGAAPPLKRWLILINPVSGPGNAVKIFGQVRPVLAANRVALTELVTTHAGHATAIKLADVDGIVCVGDDGLIYELVNGLMARPDAGAAVAQLRLGVLPGGSANSLCTSLVKAAGEPIGPMSSAYLLCRGSPQPLDLLSVAQTERPVSYGFLSCLRGAQSAHYLREGEGAVDVCGQSKVTVKNIFSGEEFSVREATQAERPQTQIHSTHMHDAVNSLRNDMPVLPPFS